MAGHHTVNGIVTGVAEILARYRLYRNQRGSHVRTSREQMVRAEVTQTFISLPDSEWCCRLRVLLT